MNPTEDASPAVIASVGPTLSEFEAGCFDPDRFDHRAHVYVAWSYLCQYSLAEAIQRFNASLRRFTERAGMPDKYHETICWFFMLQIADRRRGAASTCWATFAEEHADLLNSGSSVLRKYYSKAVLDSLQARQHFVFPDFPA